MKAVVENSVIKILTTPNGSYQELLNRFLSMANEIAFVPVAFSYDEQKGKVLKKPLAKWKDLSPEEAKKWISSIAKEYEAGLYRKGLAIVIDNEPFVVLDVDNAELFSEKVKKVEEFLEEIKPSIYLICQTNKGYHLYLPREWFKGQFNNRRLLDEYGFEIRTQGLIVIPPSKFKCGEKLYEYKVLYFNPEEPKLSNAVFEILERVYPRSYEEELKSNGKESGEWLKKVKEFAQELKKKVSFSDILGFGVRNGNGYTLYNCPFHPPDDNPSFVVYDNGGEELGFCFHEHKYYDVIELYKELKGLTFVEALRELSQIAKVELPEFLKPKKEQEEWETGWYRSLWKKPLDTEKFFLMTAYDEIPTRHGLKALRYAFYWEDKEFREVEDGIWEEIPSTTLKTLRSRYDFVKVLKADESSDSYTVRAIKQRKRIGNFVITDGVVFKDLITGKKKYNLTVQTIDEVLKVEGNSLDEIVEKLRDANVISNHKKIKDALSEAIYNLILAGRIRREEGFSQKGIFWKDVEIVLSHLNLSEPDKDAVREALSFLDHFVRTYFSHVVEKFSVVFRWFLIAPFSYLAKQRGTMIKALYLYGASSVGKSTMALISLNLWRNHHVVVEKSGSLMDTVPRLGKLVSTSTFPEIVSEPKGALTKEDVVETLKNALTGTIARAKFVEGSYQEIPALANLCFTSNHSVPKDDALIRRMYIIPFSQSERPKKTPDFSEARAKAEKLFPLIGDYLLWLVAKKDQYVINQILSLNEENALDVARELLAYLYESVGLEVPIDWLSADVEEIQDTTLETFEEEQRVVVINKLKNMFLSEMAKVYKVSPEPQALRENLLKFISAGLCKYLVRRGRSIYLTREVLDELQIPNMKVLGEILDAGEYKTHTFRLGAKTTKLSVIEFSEEEFFDLFFADWKENKLLEEKGKKKEEGSKPEDDEDEIPF